MEKLIELLNEYEKVREKSEYQKLSNKEYKWFSSYFFPLCFWHQENLSWAMTNEFREWTEDVICSKKFWFIKWLVENNKIDLWLYREYMPNLWEDFSVESNIIMNLSIAIDPIWYLNYILK